MHLIIYDLQLGSYPTRALSISFSDIHHLDASALFTNYRQDDRDTPVEKRV